jgi:hypothetical protein
MRLIPAIALDRPREVTTKYGQRLVIDCMARDTGEKITLWRGADDDYSRRYVIKNSPLTVGIDSKGKYSLVEDTALVNLGQPLPESPVPVRPVYNHKIEQSSNYVTEMAKLYKYCLDQVDATIGVEGEDKRAIATTLYLSAQKKFSL